METDSRSSSGLSVSVCLPSHAIWDSVAAASRADVQGKDMKDAFQQEGELQEGDIIMGPNGKPTLSPEAAQRKAARDKERAEEVSC